MSNANKMSQHERNEKHRTDHPEDEAWRKDKQRHRDSLMRFHIRRNYLYGSAFPCEMDQGSDAFLRVRAAYMEQVDEAVEVSA